DDEAPPRGGDAPRLVEEARGVLEVVQRVLHEDRLERPRSEREPLAHPRDEGEIIAGPFDGHRVDPPVLAGAEPPRAPEPTVPARGLQRAPTDAAAPGRESVAPEVGDPHVRRARPAVAGALCAPLAK